MSKSSPKPRPKGRKEGHSTRPQPPSVNAGPVKRGRPPTRPSPQQCIEEICARIIAGEGIVKICEDTNMPHQAAVYLSMAQDDVFQRRIARAREAQQEAIIDGTIDLADTANPENVQVVKLQIWARQWRAAKLAPKKYGDRVEIEQSQKFIPLSELAARIAAEPEDE